MRVFEAAQLGPKAGFFGNIITIHCSRSSSRKYGVSDFLEYLEMCKFNNISKCFSITNRLCTWAKLLARS